jgi:hypothetical protein
LLTISRNKNCDKLAFTQNLHSQLTILALKV